MGDTTATVIASIRQQAVPIKGPDGGEVATLSVARVQALARQADLPMRTIEIAALEQDVIPLRYLRNRTTYDTADQLRLLTSRVAVVGLGGLGGTLAEILARAGVGALTLIDGDRFEDHNLNRQLLGTHASLGHSKAAAAGQRIAGVNPAVGTTVHETFLTAANAAGLIAECRVAVDCLDNIASRFVLPLLGGQPGGAVGPSGNAEGSLPPMRAASR